MSNYKIESEEGLVIKILSYKLLQIEFAGSSALEVIELAKQDRIKSYKKDLEIPDEVEDEKEIMGKAMNSLLYTLKGYIRKKNPQEKFSPGARFQHTINGFYGFYRYEIDFDYSVDNNYINTIKVTDIAEDTIGKNNLFAGSFDIQIKN